MPAQQVDLNTLTLVPRPREVDEDEEYYSDEDEEFPWLKTLVYDIKTPTKVVGSLTLWVVNVDDIRDEFYGVMDEPSQECMEFAFTLFTESGDLRERFSREGTGVWGSEVDEGVLTYLESINVDEAYRGQGIATRALQKVSDLPGMDPMSSFIFTWPTGTSSREPVSTEEWEQQRERLARLFRSVGYRRVGHTGFFCLAQDPRHPSRQIPAASDAPYREKKEDSDDRDDAFSSMMGQWGVPGYPR
ncbi:hypothetical protein BCR35DRAFT_352734 [Leucosporidium creatinivorum]|uniref:N-acetyltransferase domain-containing protein n=1 Tax=Leucosporidium creatinivorum TaxID=106004 RepID=A0A1Y2F624_9BASI|nr:hypothetical protein BCR35DRAFT_352734 [Leucosporidium creatinivorum]